MSQKTTREKWYENKIRVGEKILEMRVIEGKRVKEKVGEKVEEKVEEKVGVKLGKNEIKILKLIENNRFITIKELSQSLKISNLSVYRNIRKLKAIGVLKRVGPDKGGHWEIIEK